LNYVKNSKAPVRICVPVCKRRLEDVLKTVVAAEEIGDLVEVRLDCLDQTELQQVMITELLARAHVPLIFTLRPVEQGGSADISSEKRLKFWSSISTGDSLIDVELDLADDLGSRPDWGQIICSHHDFSGVPTDLDQLFTRMAATPARVLKIAVQAAEVTDCLPVFELLDRACEQRRDIIAIAMGEAGVATRILGPSRGAYLTYGSLEPSSATAPGQVSARDLRELYHIESISRNTMVTGLVGWPVDHSVSPHMHNAAFVAGGVDGVYLPFAVRELDPFMRRMVKAKTRELDWNLRGLSITAPFKSAATQFLDWIDPAAAKIGAINTIVIEGEKLLGYNTDAAAFVAPLVQKIGKLRGRRCAVIGSGGAAQTVAWALRNEDAVVVVFARNEDRGRELASRFDSQFAAFAPGLFGSFDVVINTTPLGTCGALEHESPLTAAELRGAGLAYDLVYNPLDTQFLREAAIAGCETIGGLEMLVLQALAQYQLWTGREAPPAVMNEAAERALKRWLQTT
jgi:3-dehydroquinate dehydratase/shikimate dehydrogenase